MRVQLTVAGVAVPVITQLLCQLASSHCPESRMSPALLATSQTYATWQQRLAWHSRAQDPAQLQHALPGPIPPVVDHLE